MTNEKLGLIEDEDKKQPYRMVKLDIPTHRRVRIEAINQGVPMTQLIEWALDQAGVEKDL